MSVKKELYGKTRKQEDVFLFTIENSKGMVAKITNYGAILVSLLVRNKFGILKDVVLGYDKLEDYFDNHPMFGATVGRNVNRIENAEFKIDEKVYKLKKNRGNITFIVIRKMDFIKFYGTLILLTIIQLNLVMSALMVNKASQETLMYLSPTHLQMQMA